jgi:phosphate transport system substrate-binding protein
LQVKGSIIKFAAVAAGTVATIGIMASPAAATVALSGAGSTLVQPLVQDVFIPDFEAANASDTVTYAGVGSGTGITDITNATPSSGVDFGASDAPLTSSQASACSNCVEIPWALSATSVAYNLSGVSRLKLNGTVLAKIFLGQITNWDDPAIKKLNKGVTLPNEAITPVHRSDGSGDTYVFTSFLSDVDSTFASQVGSGTTANWPGSVGTSAPKNAGVAGVLSETPGSIGYVSTFYVRDNGLTQAAIENSAGIYQTAYAQSIEAAAALLKSAPKNAGLSIVDPGWTKPKKPKVKKGHKAPKVKFTKLELTQRQAYPLSTFTYVIVRPDNQNIGALKAFISFAITPAEQKKGNAYTFEPLPKIVHDTDVADISGL